VRLVDVGKQPGQAAQQRWIEQCMIAEARQGLRVVRLKSGDPFVFGRGGEEIEALIEAGIPYEVVPGVSSALAAPALAGIPVLHRDYSSALAIVSGHACRPQEVEAWATWLHQAGTVVILMGMANLAAIAHGLQQAGVSPKMPVAVTRAGSPSAALTVIGPLAEIADTAHNVGAPAVIVIGQVVTWKQHWDGVCCGEDHAEQLPSMAREVACI
jgi:uroporphyrin-III C-methyltransferase